MAEETKKYTWHEMWDLLTKFNEDNDYKVKGTEKKLWAVAVITEDSFDDEYDEESRSYLYSNDNKAFLPNQISNSIFSNCLDGLDNGVRLDWYIPEEWTVDYCYLYEDEDEEVE